MTVFPAQNAGRPGSGEVFYPADFGSIFGGGYLVENGLAASSPKGVMSFWFNSASMANGQCVLRIIDSGPSGVASVATFSGFLAMGFIKGGSNAGPSTLIANIGTFGDSKWHHVLCSWDSTIDPQSNWLINSYIDGVKNSVPAALTGGNTGTSPQWFIGRDYDGTQSFNGQLDEFYLCFGTYLDLDVLENRRKFLTASKRPAFLGTDGSLPTGATPDVYLKKVDGSNSGSGGNFTIIGLLGITTTTPSSP